MRTIHKIGVGILVGLFFAGGYTASLRVNNRNQAIAANKEASMQLSQGTRVATNNLDAVADVDIKPVQTLYDVVNNLRQHYVEQISSKDEGKMTYDAIHAMLESLGDPNTRFLEPAQRKIVEDAKQGRFHGIGAILAIDQIKKPNKQKPNEPLTEEHLMVVSVLPGSPAVKANLQPGVEITAIDGKAVLPFDPYARATKLLSKDRIKKMPRTELRKLIESEQKRIDNGIGIIEAENMLMSEDKNPIELSIVGKSSTKETKIQIQPGEFTIDPVVSSIIENDSLGYIKVSYFDSDTVEKFGKAIDSLKSSNVKGLALDLRGASGADMECAEQIAKWFAPGKPLAILVKSRNRRSIVRASDLPGSETWKKPVVLLVDKTTSRAPEILAAGLKESGATQLVGQKTYGDFINTTIIDQIDGSAIVMTTGKYLTSKHLDYNKKGLPADVVVTSGDQQLKEAVKLLSAAGEKS